MRKYYQLICEREIFGDSMQGLGVGRHNLLTKRNHRAFDEHEGCHDGVT